MQTSLFIKKNLTCLVVLPNFQVNGLLSTIGVSAFILFMESFVWLLTDLIQDIFTLDINGLISMTLTRFSNTLPLAVDCVV